MRTTLKCTIGLALAGLALAATAQAQHTTHGQGAGVPPHQGDHSGSTQQHQGDHSGSTQQHQGDHSGNAQQHQGDHAGNAQQHQGDHSGNVQQHQGEQSGNVQQHQGDHSANGQQHQGDHSGVRENHGSGKQYDPSQGASVLGDIMRQRGYTVTRIVQSGIVQNVYYRTGTGPEQLAMVGPGADRLQFRNVPAALLQEVLARLY